MERDFYAEVRKLIEEWSELGEQTIDSIRNDVTDIIDVIEDEIDE